MVLTVTGSHRPEVVPRVFDALAEREGAGAVGELVEIAGAVLRGRLALVLVVAPRLGERRNADALLPRLIGLAAELSAITGMEVDVEAAQIASSATPKADRKHVTVMGSPLPIRAVAETIRGVQAAYGRIEAQSAVAGDRFTSVELVARGAEPRILFSQLAAVAAATGTDVAIA